MYSSQPGEQIYQLSGPQILSLIKKKPFTQLIRGVQFTYSMLSKIQKRFIMTNDRFLILKGIESISYARNLPQKTTLPFKNQAEVPKPKQSYPLSAISSVTSENQILKISFAFDNHAFWEFVCQSKICALEWRKAIEGAIQKMRIFNSRKYEKYQDYTKPNSIKKIESEPPKQVQINNRQKQLSPQQQKKSSKQVILDKPAAQLIRNQSLDSLLINNPNQQKTLNKSKSDLGTNTNQAVLVKVPDNSQKQIIEGGIGRQPEKGNFSKKNVEYIGNVFHQQPTKTNPSDSSIRHFSFQPQPINEQLLIKGKEMEKNHNLPSNSHSPTPITHHIQERFHKIDFTQPQKMEINQELSKIESIFLERSIFESPSQTFLNKSFSTISMNGKEDIRSQIMSYRREWIDQLISKEEQSELMIDFKKYSKKIVEVLVNQLHIPNQQRIFPQKEWNKDFVSYIVDDVYVQIYFFTEEQIDQKHKRYQKTVKQFKNYDYFLEVTQNEHNIFVPLMSIFQFKGFVGMVKTIVCDENEPYRNQQFFSQLDKNEFQQQSRINAETLLNESKCKIVSYRKSNFLSKLVTQYEDIYFIDRLESFLPQQKVSELARSNRLLRPQLIQDEQLEQNIFGQRQKDLSGFQIISILDRKIRSFVQTLQNQEQYFTNSQELTELIHSFGLNIRHLGAIYKKITKNWLKVQFKAQLAARSLKTLFRFDLQSCILNQVERISTKQKQSERQIRRVISFLNVVFGNGEATYRVWRGLNNYSSKHYGSIIWEDKFNDISIGYFLQAIQYHLKIALAETIHQKVYFQSLRTFDQKDFLRFNPDITIYNLDFTEAFQEINECLQQINMQNFHNLCRLMIKQTRQNKTYIQILKGQPIYQKINQYLLNFISPLDNIDFYNKLQAVNMPNRFIYESKLAQIRWFLKVNKLDELNKIINFIEINGRKWLGPNHPLFVHLNRILAEYYCDHKSFYMKAIALATSSLQMQSILLGTDSQSLWKDYFLLGKIFYSHEHFQQALSPLSKAKKLINYQNQSQLQHFSQLFIYLSKCYRALKMTKQSYLNIRELYNILKEEGNQFLFEYLLECVLMIKDLLEKNQQYQSYYRFIETDFSHIMFLFADNPEILQQTIKSIFVPYLKSIIFQKSRNRLKVFSLLDQISKLTQSTYTCIAYIQQKIKEKKFPFIYLQALKDIDNIVDEIYDNQLLQKWVSFHRMSNETLLQRIGGNQINRGFQFLADLSAVIGSLGNEAIRQLSVMEK